MTDTNANEPQDPTSSRAQRILDAVPLIACVVALKEGRLAAYNAELVRALGCRDGELGAHGVEALSKRIHPDDLAGLAEIAARLKTARDGEVLEREVRARGREGDERIFAARSEVFARSEDGSAREILVCAEDVTARKRRERSLHRSDALLALFGARAPALMFAKDPDGAFLLASRSMEEFLGVPAGSMIGKTDKDLFPPEVASIFRDVDDFVRKNGAPFEAEEPMPRAQGERTFYSIRFPLRGEGIPEGSIAGISVDITRVKAAESERESARDELIASQQDTIRALVTPLLPIADGVIVMPLIGLIDDARASCIIEALLEGVSKHAARIAIIDITGVKSVDAQVAGVLMQAARGARLLGAGVVLTGIQPAIARTLIELGVDWQGLVTEATLRGGIAYALHTAGAGVDRPRASW